MMNAGMRAAFHQSAAQPFQGSHSRDAIPDIVYHRHKSQQSQVAAAPRLDLGGLRPALTMMSHGQTSHQEEAVPDPAQQALVPHRNARQDIPAGLQRFAPGAPRFSGEKTYETAGGKSADGAGQATTMEDMEESCFAGLKHRPALKRLAGKKLLRKNLKINVRMRNVRMRSLMMRNLKMKMMLAISL